MKVFFVKCVSISHKYFAVANNIWDPSAVIFAPSSGKVKFGLIIKRIKTVLSCSLYFLNFRKLENIGNILLQDILLLFSLK